jgi:hypothetical protein
MATLLKIWHLLDFLFPERPVFVRKLPVWQSLLIFAGLTALFSLVGSFLPANGFIGFDWVNFFSIHRITSFHPPWTIFAVAPLTWPLLIGLTLSSVTFATILRSNHPLSAAAAILCLPVLWTVFLGQLEGLVLLGLLGLPWLTPLALIKPQVSFFAFGARRSYLIALVLVIGVSLLIWGPWPLRMLSVESYYAEGRYPQNIALGWWGLPLTLATAWFSRGDLDMLMLSGAFTTPHLIPYNLLPLTPALARLRPRAALLGCFFSWLPLSANYIGPFGWWLGWFFVAWLWLNLAAQRYPHARFLAWINKL